MEPITVIVNKIPTGIKTNPNIMAIKLPVKLIKNWASFPNNIKGKNKIFKTNIPLDILLLL